MRFQLVLRVVTKIFIPVILLFALYVQFHGDFGPGGGFQAGVIFAAAFVLHTLVFGLDDTQRFAKPPLVHALIALGEPDRAASAFEQAAKLGAAGEHAEELQAAHEEGTSCNCF